MVSVHFNCKMNNPNPNWLQDRPVLTGLLSRDLDEYNHAVAMTANSMSGYKSAMAALCSVILLPLKQSTLLRCNELGLAVVSSCFYACHGFTGSVDAFCRYAVSGEILWHEDNVGFASILYEVTS